MPRTGGIYTPPAGTKGIPLTTILSSTFNAYVDDITADANAARPITAGGTGATSASGARTALGLEIGSDVQAQDPGLASIAGLTTAANQMLYTTAADAYATTALTPFARTILDDIDAAAARTTLGLVPGTNVQAYDAGLQSIAGLTTAANQMLYTTAADAYATTALTPFARTVLDDADAVTARATLGADNASNIILGTLADARLPTTMGPKIFTGGPTLSVGAGGTVALYYAIGGTDRARLVADGPADIVALQKFSTAGAFQSQLQINGAGATDLKFRNSTVWTAENGGPGSGLNSDLLDGQHGSFYQNVGNATGTLPAASLPANMGSNKTFSDSVYINGAGNTHVWFQQGGVTRGLVYYNPTDNALVFQLHNSSGTYVRSMSYRQSDGRLYIDGFVYSTAEVQAGSAVMYTDGNMKFAGTMQTTYGDYLSSALAARIKNDGGTYGINITGNAATLGGLAASAFKRSPSTSTNASETNFPIGHVVVAEGIINRNQVANIYLHGSLAYGYQVSPVGAGTICAGAWLGRGGSAAGSTFTSLERIA